MHAVSRGRSLGAYSLAGLWGLRSNRACFGRATLPGHIRFRLECEKSVKTILLVETRAERRIALAMILRAHGYAVLEAASSDEARQACQARSGPIQLLLTDFELGGDLGPHLAECLLAISPEMQVLFLLSSPPDRLSHAAILPGCAFLPKPFSPDTLANVVREITQGYGARLPEGDAVEDDLAAREEGMHEPGGPAERLRLRRRSDGWPSSEQKAKAAQ